MLLDVRGLVSGYGRVTILHGVDLAVAASEIVVVLGPNGAGKSTLMKTIAGHLQPSEGTVVLDGADITGRTAQDVAAHGVGYVPQEHNVFRELSVRDNLRIAALSYRGTKRGRRLLRSLSRRSVAIPAPVRCAHGPLGPRPRSAAMGEVQAELVRSASRNRLEAVFERFPILAQRASQRAATLSGGERQTLAVSSALVGDPLVMLLDEPAAGLAPLFVKQMVEWVRDLADAGMGVVWVVEQNPDLILAASARTYLVEGGRITDEFDSRELLKPGRLRELLLEERQEAH